MRPEANDLWTQALAEWEDAIVIYKVQRWAKVCFSCEMAAQLALKALIVERTGKPHPKIHKLQRLGELAACPKSLFDYLAILDPFYMETRYPDVGGTIPALLFASTHALKALRSALPLLQWAAKELATDGPKTEIP